MRTTPTTMVGLAVLLPALPAAAQEADAFATAIVEPQSAYIQGSAQFPTGNVDARRVLNRLDVLEPFFSTGFAVFSTGAVESSAIPGTDLGAVGPDGERSEFRLRLTPPDWARSVRYAVRAIAPRFVEPEDEAATLHDTCRVSILSDGVALDPWTREDTITRSSAAFEAAVPLQEQWLGGMEASPWLEGIHPLASGTPSIEFALVLDDGGGIATHDFLCLLDGIRFDRAEPVEGPPPGRLPFLDVQTPRDVPAGIPGTRLILEGRDLISGPEDGFAADVRPRWRIVPPPGVQHSIDDALVVPELGGDRRLVLELPALPAADGFYGLELTWGDGSGLRWPEVFQVSGVVPRVTAVVPNTGPVDGNNRVRIEGADFYNVTSVHFGDFRQATGTSIEVVSPDAIDVIVPPGTDVGAVTVTVNANGNLNDLLEAYRFALTVEQLPEEEPDPDLGPAPTCSVTRPIDPSMGLLLLLFAAARRGASPSGTGRRVRGAPSRSARRRCGGTSART